MADAGRKYIVADDIPLLEEPSKSFTSLTVWQRSHALTLEIYKMTRELPEEEKYGITAQIRRAMVSVPANIVEGYKRTGRKDKSRFYTIAQASLEEVRYYLILIKDLYRVQTDILQENLESVSKLLETYKKRMLSNTK